VELVRLTERVHYLHAAVNCGLVETDSGLLAIDTGIDRGAANKLIRAADELGRPLVAVLNTHAHADHHGGNAQLVRRLALPIYAPAVEEVVIREPQYEPIYLFGGAAPVSALRNHFLQAEPSPVDHVFRPGETVMIDGTELQIVDLAGHSIAQIGVRAGGVLFAADGFFGREPLAKHGVPYLVDAGRARRSLEWLQTAEAEWFVPGHGEALTDAGPTLAANLDTIDRAFEWVRGRLREGAGSTEELLTEFAAAMQLRMTDPSGWVLNRATLLAFLSALERDAEAAVLIDGGRWLWTERV
jgi:glyoxylase-like metal-dependent hydrolase (beta-lactamase superfamily II)